MGRADIFAGVRAALGIVAAAALMACASDLRAVDGGYRHSRHGYQISNPPSPSNSSSSASSQAEASGEVASTAGAWQLADIDGTALAYRRAGPQVMSFQSRCNRPVTRAPVMARQLLIGLDPGIVEQAHPVAHQDADGWVQVFETTLDGRTVRVKTVTLVATGCSYDWVLTVSGPFDVAERDFDAWWQSFRLDSYTESGSGEPG